jgi:hypothetical protein
MNESNARMDNDAAAARHLRKLLEVAQPYVRFVGYL